MGAMTDKDLVAGLPIGAKTDATPAKRPQQTVLAGRDVSLVPLQPAEHAEALYHGTHGPEKEAIWLYLSSGPFADLAAFTRYLEKCAASDDPLSFAIVDNATREAVGHASYMRITPEHRVIDVGNIFYTPTLMRKRGGTEAMYLMARYVFEDLGYRRYEWKCNALNRLSRRAALRLGFSFEGIFLQHMVQKGRSRDTAWFSMLDSEWASYKPAHETWLSASNFDASGAQRQPLGHFLKPTR